MLSTTRSTSTARRMTRSMATGMESMPIWTTMIGLGGMVSKSKKMASGFWTMTTRMTMRPGGMSRRTTRTTMMVNLNKIKYQVHPRRSHCLRSLMSWTWSKTTMVKEKDRMTAASTVDRSGIKFATALWRGKDRLRQQDIPRKARENLARARHGDGDRLEKAAKASLERTGKEKERARRATRVMAKAVGMPQQQLPGSWISRTASQTVRRRLRPRTRFRSLPSTHRQKRCCRGHRKPQLRQLAWMTPRTPRMLPSPTRSTCLPLTSSSTSMRRRTTLWWEEKSGGVWS